MRANRVKAAWWLMLALTACGRMLLVGDDTQELEELPPEVIDAGGVDAGAIDGGAGDAGLDAGCVELTDCQLACQHGFARDVHGCEECSCAPAPDAGCGPTFCQLACPFGFKSNARGCGLCQCSPQPMASCMPAACSLTCPNGFNRDSTGCPFCECSGP